MLECVVNLSEGRRRAVLEAVEAAGGDDLLDLHVDPDHNRAVLTLVGEGAPRDVARAAVELVDLRRHSGAHPRLGAVDVVPFVAVGATTPEEALAARDRFASWVVTSLGLPALRYGGGCPSLPEVRRTARRLRLDVHPTAGAVAVGARPVLVAWNLWLAEPDLEVARRVAAALRGPGVRALGLAVGRRVQVSCNLVDPLETGPAEVWDRVEAVVPVAGAELVGLAPAGVLAATPEARWDQLDLDPDRTIEARLARRAARLGLGR